MTLIEYQGKKKTIIISKKKITQKCNIIKLGKNSSDERCSAEYNSRIGQGKALFQIMKSLFCGKPLSINTTKRIQKYIEPALGLAVSLEMYTNK